MNSPLLKWTIYLPRYINHLPSTKHDKYSHHSLPIILSPKVATLRQEEKKLEDYLRNLRVQLQEGKSAEQDNSTRSKLLESLMQAKHKKQLQGIHGRLGDLGTIAPKYDIAISTACGALNHIVVDTTRDGEEAVKFLRNNKLGVATFIILDKQESLIPQMERRFQCPPNSERLFDLVKPKERMYLPAFYYALHDTLVAKDLDEATRIAYTGETRHRVVTLEGQLIDTSGTMSGGGNKVASGGMKATLSSSMSAEEISSLEKECNVQTEKMNTLRNRIYELETKMVDGLRARVAQLMMEIPKMEMDLQSIQTQQKTLTDRLPELEEQVYL